MTIVVVLFGSADPEWCDLNYCPASVHLFDNDVYAEAFMEEQPEWTRPHKLRVHAEAPTVRSEARNHESAPKSADTPKGAHTGPQGEHNETPGGAP